MDLIIKNNRESQLEVKTESINISLAEKCLIDPDLILQNPIKIGDEDNIEDLLEKLRILDQPIMTYTYSIDAIHDNFLTGNKDWLSDAIDKDFKELEGSFADSCIIDNPIELTERHLNVICELGGYLPDSTMFSDLCVIHAYLCTGYVANDLLFDNQAIDNNLFLSISPILLTVQKRVFDLLKDSSRSDVMQVISNLNECILLQRKSLLEEKSYRSNPLSVSEEDEFETIVGKASCALFMVNLVSYLSNIAVSKEIQSTINTYLYLAQLIDDLGDWREDYNNDNYTSILRQCFNINRELTNEAKLEKCIYLSGIYEGRLIKVINGLDNLRFNLKNFQRDYPYTFSVLTGERDNIFEILCNFISVKSRFLDL